MKTIQYVLFVVYAIICFYLLFIASLYGINWIVTKKLLWFLVYDVLFSMSFFMLIALMLLVLQKIFRANNYAITDGFKVGVVILLGLISLGILINHIIIFPLDDTWSVWVKKIVLILSCFGLFVAMGLNMIKEDINEKKDEL